MKKDLLCIAERSQSIMERQGRSMPRDTSHLGKPAIESSMFDVPLSSLFSINPSPYTDGCHPPSWCISLLSYTSLELLPEAYIKGESTASVGNDLNHHSISATIHSLL